MKDFTELVSDLSLGRAFELLYLTFIVPFAMGKFSYKWEISVTYSVTHAWEWLSL